MGEREMPAEQCTKIFPFPLPLPPPLFLDDTDEEDSEASSIAESMISQAASTIFDMEEKVESLMERRWYVTPSTLPLPAPPWEEGLAPILNIRMEGGRAKLDCCCGVV